LALANPPTSVTMVINPELKKEIPIGITICDIFGWRFNSKGIQIIIALIASIFYIPYVQAQIAGIAMALKYLGIGFEFEPAVIISAIIAFIYIAVVGIRSTAYVSILKDVLLLLAIVAVGFAAGMAMPGGVGGIFHAAAIKMPKLLNVTTNPITAGATFTISTIIFQMLGFYMSPNAVQAVLTSKGTKNLRLYMVMFPFLVITAYFALLTVPGLKQADYALLAVTVKLLPPWVVGLVAGGTALTGIIGVAVRALAVGGLFSKNVLGVIKPELDQKYMVGWTQAVTGLFIIVSVIVTLYYLTLLATITNIAYSGISQSFVCFMLAFFWKGSTKWGGAGLLCHRSSEIVVF
jgi:SSS family solute:Na+ symporter